MKYGHPYRQAIAAHARRRSRDRQEQENAMYRMTLKEQAEVLAQIMTIGPSDSTRSDAIAAARAGSATREQIATIHAALARYAQLGGGNERSEARRALEQREETGGTVRWYRDAPENHRV